MLDKKRQLPSSGLIPKDTLCPFEKRCSLPCKIRGDNNRSRDMSCAMARVFDMIPDIAPNLHDAAKKDLIRRN